MIDTFNITPTLYPPPSPHGILPLMLDLKLHQHHQYLQTVSLATSLSDEAASIQMTISMAGLMRDIGWLQFFMSICLGWYLVCHFFKKWGNPLALGTASGISHLACLPLYIIFDGLHRYCLNYICPDLSSPWTPFLLSDPWKVRLAGYVFITLALHVLRLAMLTVGRMHQHLSIAFASLSNSEFAFARKNWYRGYVDMGDYARLFWAVWYGGYSALYNLQLIGYSSLDRSGGRVGDILEGLKSFLKCSHEIEDDGRFAGLSFGQIEVGGLRSFAASITDRLPPRGPLPNILADARHDERFERARLFWRLCDELGSLFDEDRLEEIFDASLRKYNTYLENNLLYPSVAELEDVPRTWYAFVFDLLGGFRFMEMLASKWEVATSKIYRAYLHFRVAYLTSKIWVCEKVTAAFWFVVNLLRDMFWIVVKLLGYVLICTVYLLLCGLEGAFLIIYGLFAWPVSLLGYVCRMPFPNLGRPVPKRQCVICTEELTDDLAATQVDCHGRDMHLQCLLQWTNTSPSCPICRVQLPRDLGIEG